MRSHLVFGALEQISNRYRLCKLATKATRKIHRPHTRLQDTINEVFIRVQGANPEAQIAERAPAYPSGWCGSLGRLDPAEFRGSFPPLELSDDVSLEELASYAAER
jgi:hypothetical protein